MLPRLTDEQSAQLQQVCDGQQLPGETTAALVSATQSELTSLALPSDLDAGAPLLQWDIDLRVAPADETELLVQHSLRLFHVSGIADVFGMKPEALLGALIELRDAYMPNPFHSWRHALMVMHKAFLIAVKTRFCRWISRADLCALLLAAVGHDVGHLGRNNTFEIRAESPLARRYNNKSPLENHHTATLFQVIARHNLLGALSREQRAYTRQLIIDMITATDMAMHQAHPIPTRSTPPHARTHASACVVAGPTRGAARSARSRPAV
jgi:hypothetical protein